jgi:lipid II:glycine glycyltransferase (peptidoglycan interpeptide bridge formation enzyme)
MKQYLENKMTKEEELQNSLSKTIDYYENYISKLNHQSVMVYAAARNYEDKCKLLKDQLALTEKALELACKELRDNSCMQCNSCNRFEMCDYVLSTYPASYFIEEAKEMMKSE